MANASLVLELKTESTSANLAERFERDANDGQGLALELSEYFRRLSSGLERGRLSIYRSDVAPVKAAATFTLDTVIATDAVAIGGTTLTCVASGATAAQFNLGEDDDETAANLALAINANTTLNKLVSATSAAAVVTVTALQAGLLGSQITFTSADSTIVASAARLAGGAGGAQTAAVTFGFGI